MSTIFILLAVWSGLNAAFFSLRLYIAADDKPNVETDLVRYPRPVN